jgi:hypothetical protein
MERETKLVEISGGHKLVLKTYMTARESNQVQSAYMLHATLDPETQKLDTSKITVESMQDATKALIENMVVSFDGITENVYDTLLDQRIETFNAVREECMKAQEGGFTSAK